MKNLIKYGLFCAVFSLLFTNCQSEPIEKGSAEHIRGWHPIRFTVQELTLLHVFCALNKNKLKPHFWVPYLFPTP